MDRIRTISVLMTEHKGWLAKAIWFFTGFSYTHAAISFNADDFYYSFNLKGFSKEKPHFHKSTIKKSICYKIPLNFGEYEKALEFVEDFKSRSEHLKYSRLGVVLCCLRIPHKFRYSYFCSQFVAELLDNTRIVDLKHDPSVYSPGKLNILLRRQFRDMEIISNPI